MRIPGKNLLILLLMVSLTYAGNDGGNNLIVLNKEFYSDFLKIDPIKRDFYLDTKLNNIIQGRGYVESVDIYERYQKKYRIIITDSEALNLNIRYNIFTNNGDYLTLLKKSELFEFKGQFVIYTPLNSRKDSYIFDIILSSGALIVK